MSELCQRGIQVNNRSGPIGTAGPVATESPGGMVVAAEMERWLRHSPGVTACAGTLAVGMGNSVSEKIAGATEQMFAGGRHGLQSAKSYVVARLRSIPATSEKHVFLSQPVLASTPFAALHKSMLRIDSLGKACLQDGTLPDHTERCLILSL